MDQDRVNEVIRALWKKNLTNSDILVSDYEIYKHLKKLGWADYKIIKDKIIFVSRTPNTPKR